LKEASLLLFLLLHRVFQLHLRIIVLHNYQVHPFYQQVSKAQVLLSVLHQLSNQRQASLLFQQVQLHHCVLLVIIKEVTTRSMKHGKILPNVSTTLVLKSLIHVSQVMSAHKLKFQLQFVQNVHKVMILLKIQLHAVQNVFQLKRFQVFVKSRTLELLQSQWKIKALNVHLKYHTNTLVALVFVNLQFLPSLETPC